MGIRTALRQATALQHHSLEASPLIATLLQPDITLANIVRIEQALESYHALATLRLSAWRGDLGYAPFPHAAVLAADLNCLSSAPRGDLHPHIPEFTSLADAMGYLYVAEGSLLGNRLIARHLATALPDYHQQGGQYYRDDAGRAATHWQALCARLEDFSENPPALAAMTARAQLTFAGIEDCLGMFHAKPGSTVARQTGSA